VASYVIISTASVQSGQLNHRVAHEMSYHWLCK